MKFEIEWERMGMENHFIFKSKKIKQAIWKVSMVFLPKQKMKNSLKNKMKYPFNSSYKPVKIEREGGDFPFPHQYIHGLIQFWQFVIPIMQLLNFRPNGGDERLATALSVTAFCRCCDPCCCGSLRASGRDPFTLWVQWLLNLLETSLSNSLFYSFIHLLKRKKHIKASG